MASVEPPTVAEDYEERFVALQKWQRTLYDGGWVGIQWPREFGGQGLTTEHALLVAEELVRARLPQPVGSIGLEVVGPTILRHATDAQRLRFLAPLLSGEELWCQGFSEPGAGSDLASLRTRAVLDGDSYVLSGQKVWTSWATHARWCAVLARTDPGVPKHRGISYLLVDMRSPGVSVRPIVQMTGDAEFNELFFDEVRVPGENVVGRPGDGWRLAMDTLGHERSGYTLRRRLENESRFIELIEAARFERATRPERGALINRNMPALGELFVALKTLEAQCQGTAARLGRGDVPSPLDSIDKLTLTHTEQQLYSVASDVLGPERMTRPDGGDGLGAGDWIRGLLYARAASVYGGSSQIQNGIVAERYLGLPKAI